MQSLKADFDELIKQISHGREVGHASFEPIYYLIFAPEQIIEVKRQTPAMISRLQNEGWKVREFSIQKQILDALQNDPRWDLWKMLDRKKPQNWKATNESLTNALVKDAALQNRLESWIEETSREKDSLILVTDLEALHPYIRIGTVESQLQSKFKVPTVFLYPGIRTGKTLLKFLGFYPEDGNYRSVHIGG